MPAPDGEASARLFPPPGLRLACMSHHPAGAARRKADRERRTARGHRRGSNMPPMPRHSRAMPLHNAQESGDRAAPLSPPDLTPTGADGVFVSHNGVITLNINRPPTEKKTEGLQYQEATIRQSRGWKKP